MLEYLSFESISLVLLDSLGTVVFMLKVEKMFEYFYLIEKINSEVLIFKDLSLN